MSQVTLKHLFEKLDVNVLGVAEGRVKVTVWDDIGG